MPTTVNEAPPETAPEESAASREISTMAHELMAMKFHLRQARVARLTGEVKSYLFHLRWFLLSSHHALASSRRLRQSRKGGATPTPIPARISDP